MPHDPGERFDRLLADIHTAFLTRLAAQEEALLHQTAEQLVADLMVEPHPRVPPRARLARAWRQLQRLLPRLRGGARVSVSSEGTTIIDITFHEVSPRGGDDNEREGAYDGCDPR